MPALYSIIPRFVAFTVYSCVVVSASAPLARFLSLGLSLNSLFGLVYCMVSLAYPALYFS